MDEGTAGSQLSRNHRKPVQSSKAVRLGRDRPGNFQEDCTASEQLPICLCAITCHQLGQTLAVVLELTCGIHRASPSMGFQPPLHCSPPPAAASAMFRVRSCGEVQIGRLLWV